MKRLIIFIFLFIPLMINSCTQSSENWCMFQASGLKTKDQRFTKMIFINDKEGFIFGSEDHDSFTDDNLTKTSRNSIIGHTIDSGNSWKVTKIGEESIISTALWNGKDLLAIMVNDKMYDSSAVYLSKNDYLNWDKIFSWNGKIYNLIYYNNLEIIIYAQQTNLGSGLFKSIDGGITWKKLNDVIQPIYYPHYTEENHIFYIGSSTPALAHYKKDLLIDYNFHNQKSKTKENLPIGFDCELLKQFDSNLFLVGIEYGLNVVIYKREGVNKYKKLYRFSNEKELFPIDIHKQANEFILLMGEMKSIYVKYSVYRSVNNGQNWIKEELPEPLNAKIISFFSDNSQKKIFTWINSGTGKFQIPCHQIPK